MNLISNTRNSYFWIDPKRLLRRLRYTQPFNCISTSMVRYAAALLRIEPTRAMRHLHRVGTVTCQLPNGENLKLFTCGDDSAANRIYWLGWDAYEPQMARLFYHLARRSHTILDIGAHTGYLSLLAALSNPSAQVFAFEPLPVAFQRLKENVRLNGVDNVACVGAAVSRKPGRATLFQPTSSQLPTTSSLKSDCVRPSEARAGLQSVGVPVVDIDSYLKMRHAPRVDLIKIDVEGSECGVLEGMIKTIERNRPTVICELLDRCGNFRQVQAFFASYGYSQRRLTKNGIVECRVEDPPKSGNYVFSINPLSVLYDENHE